MKSPCYKCLINPSCKVKEFRPLVNDCTILFSYIWPKEFHKCNKGGVILSVEEDLKPTAWYSLLDKESGNISIIEKKPFDLMTGMIVSRKD